MNKKCTLNPPLVRAYFIVPKICLKVQHYKSRSKREKSCLNVIKTALEEVRPA